MNSQVYTYRLSGDRANKKNHNAHVGEKGLPKATLLSVLFYELIRRLIQFKLSSIIELI